MQGRKAPLGEWLVRLGLISAKQRDAALRAQSHTGERVGEWLIGEGALRPLDVQKARAEQLGVPFLDLTQTPPDPALLRFEDCETYLALGCLPWRVVDGVLVAACVEPGPAVESFLVERGYHTPTMVITSLYDIRRVIHDQFAGHIDRYSRNLLWILAPERSARIIFHPGQKNSLLSVIVILAALAIWQPHATLLFFIAIMNVFYCFTLLLKGLLFLHGLSAPRADMEEHESAETLLPAAELPVYTVLIPLYREAESVPHILDAMRRMDYPKSKLDIKLVCEADDAETIQAIIRARPEGFFEIIRVPASLPRTKPKACNYALTFARGELLTIYDAEDRPSPNQLRLAATVFRDAPHDVVCLQAHLNYYNRDENLLTQLFAIEYSCLFDFTLPGLERLSIPIPLGGTSNHIRLNVLRQIGAWDPYNVTEDADLGMRLAMAGLKTRVLPSLTLEEAPIHLSGWLRQRSRWIKGYMQTWLVYNRDPLKLMRVLDAPGFWGFQFFIGGPCLVFLISPFLWLLTLVWAAGLLPVSFFPDWLLLVNLTVLAGGIASHLAYALAVVGRQGWTGMGRAVAAYPFYWVLHSIASFKSAWQLVLKPHFWEKTTHGLTQKRVRTPAQ